MDLLFGCSLMNMIGLLVELRQKRGVEMDVVTEESLIGLSGRSKILVRIDKMRTIHSHDFFFLERY